MHIRILRVVIWALLAALTTSSPTFGRPSPVFGKRQPVADPDHNTTTTALRKLQTMLPLSDIHLDFAMFADELSDTRRADVMRAVYAGEHLRRGIDLGKLGPTPVPPANRPLWNSSQDLSALMYSAIAYCNNATSLSTWTCVPFCNDPLVNGTRYLAGMASAETQMTGFVAVNTLLRQIEVVFRGSYMLDNWISDLEMTKIEYPGNRPSAYVEQSVQVHHGFWLAYDSIRANVTEALAMALQAYPGYTVMFTGHSLGASVATLALVDQMVRFQLTALQVRLVTLGSPRTGNIDFVNMFVSLNVTVSRIVEENDAVPHAPPRAMGYRHIPGEKYSMGGKIYACQGLEDDECSNSRVPFLSTTSHTQFLGKHFDHQCSDSFPVNRWQW